ncbi:MULTISPECIES: beta-glucosidase [unclassified Roseateles]|uniref:beta-glucosidase family protein n=1 Tax=unclassified Roseateles TaxID=2626991 RepID=UPI0006F5AFDA|nr:MULTISPECIES: beta-glucosidase [unclassified Roseateles]KQW45439.1 beta-glucosidase [Pelomonas sp. Root405]KRA72283.1 beta-glucosidase [Pelomonas sp. Root662]
MKTLNASLLVTAVAMAICASAPTAHAASTQPWTDSNKASVQRTELLLKAMTLEEKLLLLFGYASGDQLAQVDSTIIPGVNAKEVAAKVIPGSAGYIPGIPRLGIPAQYQADASIGVRNPYLERTSLPSSLATAASWDPRVTEAGGKMIGLEARLSGFNVMLAGGINLAREPLNGRNFEYTGEDPLLAAEMGAGLIRGVQSNNIISTVKHYLINAQETGRTLVSAQISEPALRMSDALAFELAIEKSSPGSVMCSYNRINDVYACQNDKWQNQVLKRDWGYKGYVMSDWGAVHSTVQDANGGLDQQSGFPFDKVPYFAKPLRDAVDDGSVPLARIDDMARRILWAMFDKGVVDHPVKTGPIDYAAHAQVSQAAAEQSLVLLKNDAGVLPLSPTAAPKRVAIIGSYADKAVLAGGGSAVVTPIGGNAVPGLGPGGWLTQVWQPSSPMKALQKQLPATQFAFDAGTHVDAAAKAAAAADVAIVFVHQWTAESLDAPSLSLDGNQDAIVSAVAKANPNTVVVVESGGAVLMPWHKDVKGILAAFYPGAAGGEAIARLLTGAVNPSGRLPLTFPASTDQLVRPKIGGKSEGPLFTVRYTEGAAVGYKWFDLHGHKPLYAFGHGLSYTSFELGGLQASQAKAQMTVKFSVKNTGHREGASVGQVYIRAPQSARWEAPRRLVGFGKLALKPGQTGTSAVNVDPRLLATFDESTGEWVIAPGMYEVQLGAGSDDIRATAKLALVGRRFTSAQLRR